LAVKARVTIETVVDLGHHETEWNINDKTLAWEMVEQMLKQLHLPWQVTDAEEEVEE
jgi:hypothetical protein